MCGIAGMVGKRGDVVDADDVRRMCQTIVHRGPDDEGIYAEGPVGLGMRRLSIIDLAGGRQPIHNEDKSLWVVFNGEIYNFPELRQELEGRGHRFYTHSDTEVIVHLYEEMGSDCVQKLRGMFAIALWDDAQAASACWRATAWARSLCTMLCTKAGCCSDRKSKHLLAVHPELAEINPEGLLQYFYFGYIPDPHTAFQHIHKLPAGHLMEYCNGRSEDSPLLGFARVWHASGDERRGMSRRIGAATGRGGAHSFDQ